MEARGSGQVVVLDDERKRLVEFVPSLNVVEGAWVQTLWILEMTFLVSCAAFGVDSG